MALCQHIFVPFSGADTVLLEKGYTSSLLVLGPEGTGLKATELGMESLNTWHGIADVRVRGTEIINLRMRMKTMKMMKMMMNVVLLLMEQLQ